MRSNTVLQKSVVKPNTNHLRIACCRESVLRLPFDLFLSLRSCMAVLHEPLHILGYGLSLLFVHQNILVCLPKLFVLFRKPCLWLKSVCD